MGFSAEDLGFLLPWTSLIFPNLKKVEFFENSRKYMAVLDESYNDI